MSFVYMLQCADASLYTGWSEDVQRRAAAHNAGKGAKYTKARLPAAIVYQEEFATKEEAMRRECAIKKLSRAEKLKLVAAFQNAQGP